MFKSSSRVMDAVPISDSMTSSFYASRLRPSLVSALVKKAWYGAYETLTLLRGSLLVVALPFEILGLCSPPSPLVTDFLAVLTSSRSLF